MESVTPNENLTRSEQKRLQILEAAMELFCGQGFPNTSMDEVAKLAGVSKQTVYSHFGSKDELFVASIESRCVVQRLAEDVFTDPSQPEIALSCFAEYFGDLIVSPEALKVFTTCVAQSETHPGISALFFDAGPQHLLNLLTGYFEDVHKLGVYQFDDCRSCAVRLCLMMYGEMRLKLELGLNVDGLVDGRADYLTGCITMFLKAYKV